MNRLKNLRTDRRATQRQVADFLGVDRTTYTKYETGDSEPNFDIAQRLADYFEVSLDYLLGRTDNPTPPTLNEQLSGIDFALSGEIRELTDDEKQDILDFVRFKRAQKKGV